MVSLEQKENGRLVNILEKVAISALFLVVSWQWNAITKLEDRVYNLQAESFTEAKARVLEDRISKSIDGVRLHVDNQINSMRSDMNSKLDLLIKMQSKE
ncbi:MAG: hypothetical protein ACRC6V_01840 [Bacteroidales bacterium]